MAWDSFSTNMVGSLRFLILTNTHFCHEERMEVIALLGTGFFFWLAGCTYYLFQIKFVHFLTSWRWEWKKSFVWHKRKLNSWFINWNSNPFLIVALSFRWVKNFYPSLMLISKVFMHQPQVVPIIRDKNNNNWKFFCVFIKTCVCWVG